MPADYPNPQPAQSKKRKSGVPEIWKYEEAVFDLTALQMVFSGRSIPPAIQQKMDRLAEEVRQGANKRKYRKQNPANNISCGRTSVRFFLDNPSLIPVMAREQNRRKQREDAGEDLTYLELDDEKLYMHCKDRATFIYTQNESNCKDYSYSFKYRFIRNNYIYTMGRASRSAQMALKELAMYQKELSRVSAQPQPSPQPLPQPQPLPPVPPQVPPQARSTIDEDAYRDEIEQCEAEYLAAERSKIATRKRLATLKDKQAWAEERELAQLLRNECNDDFDSDDPIPHIDTEGHSSPATQVAHHKRISGLTDTALQKCFGKPERS